MTNFYELEEPTRWAGPPEHFSFSSLQAISSCPRRWQLLNSEWGEYARFPQRLQPKALEGTIVHEAIELLVRALGKRGFPSIGSDAFREALSEIDFWGHFGREMEKWNRRLAQHPRMGPFFRLKTPAREVANRTIRLFRKQYEPRNLDEARPMTSKQGSRDGIEILNFIKARGAISELKLEHPDLPFHGTIDLVENKDDGIHLIDFKTGKPKDNHQLQLQLYGILWWRVTGELPSRLVLQYMNERIELSASTYELIDAERRLVEKINATREYLTFKPAEARPGGGCGFCSVRARCAIGWERYQASIGHRESDTTDVGIIVLTEPVATGFTAELEGNHISVVYDASVGRQLISLGIGDSIRLLDVIVRDGGTTFEVRPWTEVYRVNR